MIERLLAQSGFQGGTRTRISHNVVSGLIRTPRTSTLAGIPIGPLGLVHYSLFGWIAACPAESEEEPPPGSEPETSPRLRSLKGVLAPSTSMVVFRELHCGPKNTAEAAKNHAQTEIAKWIGAGRWI